MGSRNSDAMANRSVRCLLRGLGQCSAAGERPAQHSRLPVVHRGKAVGGMAKPGYGKRWAMSR